MGNVALVTGGSKGIGRAVALDLAQAGYDVGINYHSHAHEAEETKRKILDMGRKAEVYQADVGKVEQIRAMFTKFTSDFGPIDLLVNNAGVSMFAPLVDASEELWDTINSIDWKGTYFCAQEAARLMIAHRKKGVIINLSSNQKESCWPTASIYGPVKAAIAKFTEHAALELARYGIRVLAIAPGYTDVGWPLENPVHEAKEKIPCKRFATPEEIARVIRHLVSDDFAYMAGSCLTIDGGATLAVVTETDLDTNWSSTALTPEKE
jgi:NAD(P)-dependent dehydrogenase (short-subunit alcohol dehydrogenase family)